MEAQIEINHSDVPIRLFESDFLEAFTHVHPLTVILIWVPVSIGMLYWGLTLRPVGASPAYLVEGFLIGALGWTWVEYNIHRFFFHFCPRNPWQERIVFLFHGVHHAQPRLKTRLVMPPAVSVPLAALFLTLFYLLLGRLLGLPQWVGPVSSGFTLGYLTYDLMHYATHRLPMRWGFLKYLKRHHMLHHYKTPDQRFGVSSPFWDWVYGTLPKDEPE
jgi:sterol desaturase/sphingolipid hydroxylase (fatty acid hydroxylase superfamily)